MNEKIANQISEMKKQTIGVEVEMNNITREQAAKLTADFFGTGRYKKENGNFRRTSAFRETMPINANW